MGNVPLQWYKDEEHIGYDLAGAKIGKAPRGDKLDALLARNDSRKALRCAARPPAGAAPAARLLAR